MLIIGWFKGNQSFFPCFFFSEIQQLVYSTVGSFHLGLKTNFALIAAALNTFSSKNHSVVEGGRLGPLVLGEGAVSNASSLTISLRV